MKLSIIIPAYNEEKTLEQIIKLIKRVNLIDVEKEIIVVDNNSTDKTLEIAKRIEGIIVVQENKRGKGASIKKGLTVASGNVFIIQDADLEYDPSDLPSLLEPIQAGKSLITMGVRTRVHATRKSLSYFLAYLGNKVITFVTNLLFSANFSEYEGCYKVFTKEIYKSILPSSNGFEFENELICKALKRGEKIIEVPISYNPRGYDEGKKINWKDGFCILWTIIKSRFSN